MRAETVAAWFPDVVSIARPPLETASDFSGRRRLTKQVMLVCIGLVAQAHSRLDSFPKITPPVLARSILGRHDTRCLEPLRELIGEPRRSPACLPRSVT